MNILIVDDRKENLHLLETILKSRGYEVVSAKNGIEALERLREDSIDMIISDILMPKMDGFQLCRECKKDESLRKIPLIFYTGTYIEEKDKEFALSLGAEKLILKPKEPDEIIKIIQSVLKDAIEGKLVHRKPALEEEKEVLKLYNERLVNKLEKKVLDLEKEIAERKKAEEALKQSEKKYRILVESLEEGIESVNENENFTFVNRAICNIFGYSKKELLQMNLKDIIPPEDHQKILKQTSIRKTGKSSKYDFNIIRKNGDIRTISTSVSPIIENQEYKGAFGIFRDITEKKKAEEELKKHQDHLEELVKERTAELEKKNKELKRFNKLFVGREFRIKELKDKVKELEKELIRKKY